MLNIFSYTYLPAEYLFWWGICSDLLSNFFLWGCLFSYYWVLRVLCIFWIQVLYLIMCFENSFSQSLACLFILSTVYLWSRVFNFNEVISSIFLSWIMLFKYLKAHCQSQGHLDFLLLFLGIFAFDIQVYDLFSDGSHSLKAKHWRGKILEAGGPELRGLHIGITVVTSDYFPQSESSNLSKLNNQGNQEIPKSDFLFPRGRTQEVTLFHIPPICLASLFMENIFIAVSLLNSSTSVGGRPYQMSTGWLISKGGSGDE